MPIASALAILLQSAGSTCPAQPIVDIHVHSYATESKLPFDMAMPGTGEANIVADVAGHRRSTVSELRRLGIIRALVSGRGAAAEEMIALAPDRLRFAYNLGTVPTPEDLTAIRAAHRAGRLAMIGEVSPQYRGVGPDDTRLEPLWALAEELDVPVAVHIGRGPTGIVHNGSPQHRVAQGKPLLVEGALIRHPKLKLIVMHAGFPFGDEMEALLGAYPNVYVDLGAIHFAEPRGGFHAYLRRLVNAGFGDRILFGSDSMLWPGAIAHAVQAYREATYLNRLQRRAIFFDNAVRLFGWSDLAAWCS